MYSPSLAEYIFSKVMSSLKHVLALFPSVSCVFVQCFSVCVSPHVVGGCVRGERRVLIIHVLFGGLPAVSPLSPLSFCLKNKIFVWDFLFLRETDRM